MGCDIHMYLEYKNKMDNGHWRAAIGHLNPGRHYDLFGRLAGVRSDVPQLVPLRGVPEDMSYYAAGDFWMYVSEEGGENTTSKEGAREWVERGLARWRNEKQDAVSHPDWHSHSWCSPDELKACLVAQRKANPGDWCIEYFMLLAAARELEKFGMEVRIIYWFDN